MATRTVLVLTDGGPTVVADLPALRRVRPVVLLPVDGNEAPLATRLCAAINRLDPPPSLVVVAAGSVALVLPSVALAQRSAHRRVDEYVLIEPQLPAVTDGWPDAPVTVVVDADTDDASIQGRLRGWRVLTRAQFDGWAPAD